MTLSVLKLMAQAYVGIGAVLSQKPDDWWHPIAYISKSLSDAERNYHAADLEMAAVIFALTEWRHYLLGATHPFEVLTDHQNLTYFRKSQDLSHRQARWEQLLQEYHFMFVHRSGKTNPTNPLSWRPDYGRGVELNNKSHILLPNHLFTSPNLSEEADAAVHLLQMQKQPTQDNAEAAMHPSDPGLVESMVKKLQHKREKYALKGLTKDDSHWKESQGILLYKNLLYIPKDGPLHEKIIQQHHNHPLAGHPGIRRTRDLILAKYYWPTIRKDITKYVSGCDKCQKVKPSSQASKTPLQPNEIPQAPWEIISVDIIGPLPESQGKNAILTVVD